MKIQTPSPQAAQLPPPKAIAAALKRIIEDAYDTGITRVLTFDINDQGVVFGRFHDDDQVYDYQIKPTGEIKYNEAEANGSRSDSLLIGYYVDSGALLRDSLQSRKDASPRRTGKPKCKKSKRCKGGCIARGFECNTKLSPLAITRFQGVYRAIAAMKGRQAPSAANSAFSNPKNNLTGKGDLPTSAVTKQQNKPKVNNAISQKSPSDVTAKTIAAGAAIVGLPAAAYAAKIIQYRHNLNNSAEQAKEEAAAYDVPDTVMGGFRPSYGGKGTQSKQEAEQITLLTNGFAGTNGTGGDLFAAQFSRKFASHHVVGVENPEFDIVTKTERLKRGRKYSEFGDDALTLMLKTAFSEGGNRVALRMAARAYAYHQKHPDKPINLIGYSAGGVVANETAEILKRMGVKDVKTANMGSPYYGLVPNHALNFIAPNDKARQQPGFNPPNQADLKEPIEGHGKYFVGESSRETISLLKKHFDRPETTNS
ncbi:MAG: hypothetical protein QNJ46_17655 [Leptolyngbyaceae cyanobacterium MO_188.B28]|nr:hypothetical protein [Leptolyngbyaceae cyanobacterium MO_188.B28]